MSRHRGEAVRDGGTGRGVVAAAVVLVVVGLVAVLLGTRAERTGEDQAAGVTEPRTEAAAATVAPRVGAVSPGRDAAGEVPGRLGERDPDAPVGPQPIPGADDVPVRVRIPDIGVDSSLEHLVRDADGVLQAPAVPEQAGWFSGGTVPGDRGPAVIAGHVDSGVAGAIFRDLDELEPGSEILVEMSDGEVHTFRVDRHAVVQQAQFPSAEVYGPVPDRQLRLITCHTFSPEAGDYVDNLVVFATAT